jgi:hypothetical protein
MLTARLLLVLNEHMSKPAVANAVLVSWVASAGKRAAA